MPAHNERFCEMAAVTPQTILCEFTRYYPAGSSVKPPPRKAAGTLCVSAESVVDKVSLTEKRVQSDNELKTTTDLYRRLQPDRQSFKNAENERNN